MIFEAKRDPDVVETEQKDMEELEANLSEGEEALEALKKARGVRILAQNLRRTAELEGVYGTPEAGQAQKLAQQLMEELQRVVDGN